MGSSAYARGRAAGVRERLLIVAGHAVTASAAVSA
jgi:hypothetical protein